MSILVTRSFTKRAARIAAKSVTSCCGLGTTKETRMGERRRMLGVFFPGERTNEAEAAAFKSAALLLERLGAGLINCAPLSPQDAPDEAMRADILKLPSLVGASYKNAILVTYEEAHNLPAYQRWVNADVEVITWSVDSPLEMSSIGARTEQESLLTPRELAAVRGGDVKLLTYQLISLRSSWVDRHEKIVQGIIDRGGSYMDLLDILGLPPDAEEAAWAIWTTYGGGRCPQKRHRKGDSA
ncbi:MAG: hypothetical protein WC992_02275 [Acholeplasmataceae bacterium]